MNRIVLSFSKNLSQWKLHLLLWIIKLSSLTIGFMALQISLNTITEKRDTGNLWEITEFNYFLDWMWELNANVFAYIIPVILFALLIWFLVDTFFDLRIISGLIGIKADNKYQKYRRLLFAKLIFWVPYLIIIGGSGYILFKYWMEDPNSLLFYGIIFIAAFIVLFLLKWLDLTKIQILTDAEFKFNSIFSDIGRKAFSDFKETALINLFFVLILLLFIWLTIVINVHFIATSAGILWVLWGLRQFLTLSRQLIRYSFTGVWIESS